jgi:hypothetical protein
LKFDGVVNPATAGLLHYSCGTEYRETACNRAPNRWRRVKQVELTGKEKARGQTYTINKRSFVSILETSFFNFLSFSIILDSLRLANVTSDSLMLKCEPISLSLLPVYLWQRYIATFFDKALSWVKT